MKVRQTINRTKRMMVSKTVILPRKEYFWGVTPREGRHNKTNSMAILTLLRDYLKLGDKEREITRVLNQGIVLVDGKTVKDRRFSVGFMDVITISKTGESYRILFDMKGRLFPVKETAGNADKKPVKVTGKHTIAGGKDQLAFHDGQNMITDRKDVQNGDVVLLKLPEKEIVDLFKLQQGSKVFLTGGRHVGSTATIKGIEVKESSARNLVYLEEGYSTVVDYAFPIGNQRSAFHLPAAEIDEVAK